jgi:endoglucanase
MKLPFHGRSQSASHGRRNHVSILLGVSIVTLIGAAAVSAQPAFPLHTQGQYIVDSNGYRVRLNAFNWYGTESTDYVVSGLQAQPLASIVSTIQSMGFNAVRLPWSNQMYESNPVVGNYALTANPSMEGENALTIFDQVVSALTNAGIMVILDNHSSNAEWCCSTSDGNTLWYNSSYPETSWIADWEGIIARYDSNPYVIGADLRNEPRGTATWGGSSTTDWHAASERGGNAVLSVDANMLIFVEGISYAGDLSGVSSLPVTLNTSNQVVYEAHDYGYWYSGLTGMSDYESIINPKWGYLITGSSPQPFWIGEFGTCNTATTCVSSTSNSDNGYWFGLITQYLKAHNVDWSYWAINGTTDTNHSGGFGSVETYGVLNTTWNGSSLSALTGALQTLMNAGCDIQTGNWQLTNVNSGLGMEVNGWSTSNGGIVDQWTLGSNQANQRWNITYLNNGLYQLTNVNSGLVLDAVNRGKTDGTKMQQWSNLSGSNQEYIIRRAANDTDIVITNSNSGLAVEVPGFSTSNGTQLDTWGNNGGTNQEWLLTNKQ